jgi:Schlafen, AlbA_2
MNMIGLGKSVSAISEEDLEALLNSVPESLTLDYKQELALTTSSEKCELAKDVSAFANKIGGDLIYGVQEADGVAEAVIGISQTNLDATVQTLEQLLRSSVEPRLVGYQIKQIPLKSGKACILVRVPRSLNAPHRVSHGGHNKFYVRNTNGKHEASVEELRQMFFAAASLHRSADNFRKDRVSRIMSGQTPIGINKAGGILCLHLIPLAAIASDVQVVDPRAVYKLRYENFSPIGTDEQSNQYNFDGLLIYRPGPECLGYVQVYRDGIIEATRTGVVTSPEGRRRYLPAANVDRILESAAAYFEGQARLEISPPLALVLTLTGVEGAILGLREPSNDLRPFAIDQMHFPPVIFDRYPSTEELDRALKPIFDQLWQAGGLQTCNST